MRIIFLSYCFLSLAAAQSTANNPAPLPNLAPQTVVATVADGKKLTVGELRSFVRSLPPQMQQAALRDRKALVQQYALMQKLSEMAETAKLDERSPTKEMLRFNRMYIMMTAQLNHTMDTIKVDEAEIEKYYRSHADKYAQAKVKVIYVSFASNPQAESDPKGKKYLSEPEAKAKVEKILAEIRGGADFVKMVKQHSDDATSAEKEGDFGTVRRADNVPEAIRNAIFALKAGDVSEPVRQPNGFYLFRAEEIGQRPVSEVKGEIINELKQAQFKNWMEEANRSVSVKIENEAFFSDQAPATPAPPPAKP
jgi:parvulin-like peptidyl-prolyl isomerase